LNGRCKLQTAGEHETFLDCSKQNLSQALSHPPTHQIQLNDQQMIFNPIFSVNGLKPGLDSTKKRQKIIL
jgi:hypothetical protein